jgi:Tfp pilus assembly protein PilF
MDAQLAQIDVLLNTRRFADAEARLRERLAQQPNEARTHALLAYTLSRQERSTEALTEANRAIHLDPTHPYAYYVKSGVLLALNRARPALDAIREAVRLRPDYAPYHARFSAIYIAQKKWYKAIRAAEEGLRHDPENVQCLEYRGLAQIKLGERADATESLEGALSREPENAGVHATQGWVLLHQGKQKAALEHFKEALRLDPLSEYARQGIVEALKARNPVYRFMLRYFLWMGSLTTGEQWGFVALVSSVRSGLRAIARAFPPLYIVVLPVQLLYFGFALLTWIARPLFALVLRFDPLGRLALPKEEIVASNWVGACLALALLGAVGGGITGILWQDLTLWVAVPFFLLMILPLAGVFRTPKGWGRVLLALCSALLAGIGLSAFASALFGVWALTTVLGGIFLIGWFFYPLLANIVLLILQIQRNSR